MPWMKRDICLLGLFPVSWVFSHSNYLFSTNPLCDWSHISFSIITLYFIFILWKEPLDHTENSNAWNGFTTPNTAFLKAQPKMRTSVNHPRGINFSHSNLFKGSSVLMSIFITFSAVSNSSNSSQLTNCMWTKKETLEFLLIMHHYSFTSSLITPWLLYSKKVLPIITDNQPV